VVADPAEDILQITILSGVGRVTPLAAAGGLAEGGEWAKQKHSRDDKGPVHPRSPLLSKLSGITPKRDDLRRIIIPLWLIARAWCFPNTGTKPDQTRAGRFGPCSVATHAPANDDEQIPVLGPQAPGEEVTVSLLTTTAPLGDPLGDPFAQAPAPAFITLVFISVSAVSLLATTAALGDALADPLAEAPPHVLPVTHQVDDEIPQILPRPYPVPEEIAQIAVHIAVSVAPSLS